MNVVLGATAPVFIVIALGFAAVRFGIVTAEQNRGMGAVVMRLTMPALIVSTLAQRPFAEVVDAAYLTVYGAGCVGVLVGAFCLSRFAGRLGTTESAVRALGMSAGNSGFVGFPIALGVVGPAAGVGLALCMLVENALLLPLALALAEAGTGKGGVRTVLVSTAGRLVRTPLVVAIVIGFALAASGIVLPVPVSRTLSLLAGASAPLALMVIGGSLTGLRFRSVAGPAATIAAGKLLVLPIAVAGLLVLVPVADPDLRKALLIYSASPMISIYGVIGQRFGFGEMAAAALLAATVASFATISLLLWLVA